MSHNCKQRHDELDYIWKRVPFHQLKEINSHHKSFWCKYNSLKTHQNCSWVKTHYQISLASDRYGYMTYHWYWFLTVLLAYCHFDWNQWRDNIGGIIPSIPSVTEEFSFLQIMVDVQHCMQLLYIRYKQTYMNALHQQSPSSKTWKSDYKWRIMVPSHQCVFVYGKKKDFKMKRSAKPFVAINYMKSRRQYILQTSTKQ